MRSGWTISWIQYWKIQKNYDFFLKIFFFSFSNAHVCGYISNLFIFIVSNNLFLNTSMKESVVYWTQVLLNTDYVTTPLATPMNSR